MKTKLLFFLFFLPFMHAKAQDLIILRNGDYIEAKVREVKDSVIKYIRDNDPYAMLHTVQESKVFMIKYKSGDKEVFGEPAPAVNQKGLTDSASHKNNLRVTGIIGSGTTMVGGQATFVREALGGFGNSVTDITLNGGVGYFITNNFALGVDFAFQNDAAGDGVTSLALGPFLKYFFYGTPTFIRAEYAFASASGLGASTSASALEFDLGYAAFINRHVAFESSLFYAYNSGSGISPFSAYGLNFGFQIYLRK